VTLTEEKRESKSERERLSRLFNPLALTSRQQKEKENSYELNITVCQWKRGQ
jgi:hypothetical protein